MKTLMSTLAVMAFCASALAAGLVAGPGDGGAPAGQGVMSRAKYDQILGRLGLTDEQIKKIDALYTEYQKKTMALYKELRGEGKKLSRDERTDAYKKIREKVAALNAERDKKILEVLTADQKTKYDAAAKIVATCAEKTKELSKGYADIRKLKDREQKMAAYKALGDKRRAIYTERDKQLDEKIGKLPKRPAGLEGRQQGNRLSPNGTR